jgi:hypothetical protein
MEAEKTTTSALRVKGAARQRRIDTERALTLPSFKIALADPLTTFKTQPVTFKNNHQL